MAMEQPKKPVGGSFGQFVAEKRPEFLKQCAGQKGTAVIQLASAEWKKLTDEQKAPYQIKYEAAKKKSDEDMAAFLAAGGHKTKGAAGLRREKRKAKEAGILAKHVSANVLAPVEDGFDDQAHQGGTVETPAKRARHAKSACDPEILALAKKSKLDVKLKSLFDRPEVAKLGLGASEVFEALKRADGNVVKVKQSLLRGAEHPAKSEDVHSKEPAAAFEVGAAAKPAANVAESACDLVHTQPLSKTDEAIAEILALAKKSKLDGKLKSLLDRPEVAKGGLGPSEVFEALKRADGNVVKAKKSLLHGAAHPAKSEDVDGK